MPREVRVPLSCAGQDVGWLSLWAPPHVDEQHLQRQIEGIRAALAVLMAAAENAAARPLSGVLGRAAFRSRVVSELARSQRHEEEFSVLHVRLAGARPPKGNPASGPWVAAAALGETLVDHLRRSDVVGLLGSDRLAVLLTATGRLGARIAARRVAELVSGCTDNQGGGSGFGSAALEFCLRTFPDNAADVESLCRATDWYVEAARRPAVSGVRP
jgi:GGDEF domain-containing protein